MQSELQETNGTHTYVHLYTHTHTNIHSPKHTHTYEYLHMFWRHSFNIVIFFWFLVEPFGYCNVKMNYTEMINL